VAGCVSWEKGIGASCEDENVVGDGLAGGAGDKLVLGVDFGDLGVEVVV
jgi:hypothetical protein